MAAFSYNTPLGYQQLTSVTSSTALTVPSSAGQALLQAESANVRWRDDGVAPTGGVGMLIEAGETVLYQGDLTAVRVIQAAGGAILNVSYYQ